MTTPTNHLHEGVPTMQPHEVVIDGVIYVPKTPLVLTVERATVRVPGHLTCFSYPRPDGEWQIGSMTFTPAGSSAGWFGVIAEVEHVLADGADADDELAEAVDAELRVNDTDGPFWVAMRATLATPNRVIGWSE